MRTTFVLILLLSASVYAKGSRNSAVREAMINFQKEIDDAEEVKQKAEVAALRKLLTVLELAKSNAMRAEDLEEAILLNEKIVDVNERLGLLIGPRTVVMVRGDSGWQNAGKVTQGQTIDITVTGTWSDGDITTGPDGVNGRFKLIGQINGLVPLMIGSHLQFIVPVSGKLELGMGDSDHKKGSGRLKVVMVLMK